MGSSRLLWGVYHDKDINKLREILKIYDGKNITIIIEELLGSTRTGRKEE